MYKYERASEAYYLRKRGLSGIEAGKIMGVTSQRIYKLSGLYVRILEEAPTFDDALHLSVRTVNVLKRAGITTVQDLVTRTAKELLRFSYCGQKTITEIETELERIGLSFRKEKGVSLSTPRSIAPSYRYAGMADNG